MKQIFFLTVILSGSSVNSSVNKGWFESFPINTKVPNMKIVDEICKNRTSLIFVKDSFNTIFLVKQYKEFGLAKYLFMVMERLSSYMAQEMGYPYNKIRIIPASSNFTGKPQKHLPATLHKVVPGVKVSQLKNEKLKFSNIDIRQREEGEEVGLTRGIVSCLYRHPDFPIIVGFDTFVCDKDRGRSNLFYDIITNRFYAIDFEKSFQRVNVILLAIQNLRDMKKPFSKKELRGLRRYKNTIEKLILCFPPSYTIQLFDKFCKEVLPNGLLESDEMQERVLGYKKVISESYEYSKQLVKLLLVILD